MSSFWEEIHKASTCKIRLSWGKRCQEIETLVGDYPMQRDFVSNFVEEDVNEITLWGYSLFIEEVLVTA